MDFYPVMPGVLCESPTIYNAALKASLEPLQLTTGSALLQYVDDILLCSPSKQFVQDKVTFLGHVISKDGRSLSPKRVAAVQNIPKLVTKKQLI